MEQTALLEALLELASDTGLAVQRVGGPAFEGLAPSGSGVCTLRGEVRVVLSDSDPLPARIRVLASALRSRRGAEIEDRFLPPAVRECLEAPPGEP